MTCWRRAGASVLAAPLSPLLPATLAHLLPTADLPLSLAFQCPTSILQWRVPHISWRHVHKSSAATCTLCRQAGAALVTLSKLPCFAVLATRHQPDATAYHSMPICQPGLICGCECRTWAA